MELRDPQIVMEAWDQAVDRLAGRTNVASALRTRGWERVPLALRERAFFSAGVESARELQMIRSATAKALQGFDPDRRRADGTPMTYSSADAVADIRRSLGVVGDSGDLRDLGSYRRQELIQRFQAQQAYEYGRWKRDLEDPELLDEFPAWEFARVEPRDKPRTTWRQRWAAAGAAVGWQGASRARMAALKTSPIWAELSRFDTPYPPFDFGSGMGLVDLPREEAERLGLIPPGWDPAEDGREAQEDFAAQVEASAENLDEGTRAWLEREMRGAVRFEGSRAVLQPQPPREPLPEIPQGQRPPPAGTPVGDKFDVEGPPPQERLPQATRTEVREAAQAVDQVHGDGPLARRPVDRRVSPGSDGTYRPGADTIGIKAGGEGAGFHFFHEMGHRLDFKGLAAGGTARPASAYTRGAMSRVMDAIHASEAVRALRSEPMGRPYRVYATSREELFARAYSQFAATESGHPGALAWLDKVRAGQTGYRRHMQWTDEDFAPIRRAFIDLMQEQGWMEGANP